jgi:hypothetical protein
MKSSFLLTSVLAVGTFGLCQPNAGAAVQVLTEINQSPFQVEESLYYQFDTIPTLSSTDLANGIVPTIVGTFAPASAPASVLTDGKGAPSGDDPANNIFFHDPIASPKTIIFDLGAVSSIAQVNAYSWHSTPYDGYSGVRAPQEFTLYASAGITVGFDSSDIGSPGWAQLAIVDSEVPGGWAANAGQHGVSVSDTTGSLGSFRYIALDVRSPFGYNNTFYSEIDVVAVPEPSIFAIVATGCIALVGLRRRSGQDA